MEMDSRSVERNPAREICPRCLNSYSNKYIGVHKRKYCSQRDNIPVNVIRSTQRISVNKIPEICPMEPSSVFESPESRKEKKITYQIQEGGPWYHRCEKCRLQFRCVPMRPSKDVITRTRTVKSPCRCIEWCRRKSFFCSNSCFWDAMSIAPEEPALWIL